MGLEGLSAATIMSSSSYEMKDPVTQSVKIFNRENSVPRNDFYT